MNVLRNSRGPIHARKWRQGCQSTVASADDAVAHIQAGQRVFLATGCGQPQILVNALLRRARELEDLEIVHLIRFKEPVYRHDELAQRFRLRPFFLADGVDVDACGHLGDYTPILLSDISALFHSGRLPLDVALIQVTEPNERGLCSLGVSVDVTKKAAENAALVIAQVNRHMPWTTGDSLLCAHDLDILVPWDEPLIELEPPEPDETSFQIAEYLAALIPDNSTVHFGAHRITQALLQSLKEKRDLGIHTEVVSDGILELIDSGAVTGVRKSSDRGRVVCSMCLGTQKLYRYIDKNPAFCFRSAEYVNDPAIVSRQGNRVAVGVASEIDLMGQVCLYSPQAGGSGIITHADFVHGAISAPGGKMMIALESTRDDGAVSRIVPRLGEGAAVAVTSSEVHYVATEYGVAYLHGKSLQERVVALISIAHPGFRAGLLREAIERNYVSTDLTGLEGRFHVGPPPLQSSTVLQDGTLVSFRPMHPTDDGRMHELFHSLSRQTMYYRFMADVARLPQRMIQDFVYVDYRHEMAIVGTVPEAYGEEIIAVGRYYLNPGTNYAEVAFIVRDEWQRRGLGTFLLKYLATIARGQGIAGFTAEVLADNQAMLGVLRNSGFRVRTRLEGRVRSIEMDFE
jgi:acyl-CoA hydrolase/GNAT superfamily N-acetyltransferase